MMSERIITVKKNLKDYQIIDKFIAGIVLSGDEVKSIRSGQVSIDQAYVSHINKELWIINMIVSAYDKSETVSRRKHNHTHQRKILLKKNEIYKVVIKSKSKRLVIIPTRLLTKKRWIKVEISLVKHLRKFQIKERDKQFSIKKNLQKQIEDREY